MSNIHEYIAPNVQRQRKFKGFRKKIESVFEIIWHGLTPHETPKEPQKSIKAEFTNFQDDDTLYYQASLEMYKDSKERIKHLEEKAFRLLTYISALSAILLFFLGREINLFTKVVVILSVIILVSALIISLRCIGIKVQKTLFIDSIFEFNDADPQLKSKQEVCAEVLNCAVYNQTVGDNTSDILKASRYILSFGIFTTVIALLSFTLCQNPKAQVYKVDVGFSDSTILDSVKYNLKLHNETFLKNNEIISDAAKNDELQVYKLDSINKSVKGLYPQIDSLKKAKSSKY